MQYVYALQGGTGSWEFCSHHSWTFVREVNTVFFSITFSLFFLLFASWINYITSRWQRALWSFEGCFFVVILQENVLRIVKCKTLLNKWGLNVTECEIVLTRGVSLAHVRLQLCPLIACAFSSYKNNCVELNKTKK